MKTFKHSTLALLVAACFNGAAAAPTLPQVVNGQATFSQQGNVFSITNTPNTIINWQSFSVDPGEVTRFIQQSDSSAVLNRILGQDPSRILGALQSNGRVFLINPNGILFGRDSRVDVNGLLASTLSLSDADFLAGKKNFASGATAGNVSNQGAITTASGGQVFLIAPNVENTGIITSAKGEVVLAAGHTVQLADSGNPDLHVVVSAPAGQAINLGQVIAQGGKVGIYGALINQRGVVNANSALVGENGKIVFKASGDTLLEAGSVTTATGAGTGGQIHILGDRVGLTGAAKVDASGAAGGGTVLIGGDYQGKNAAIRNAEQVFVDKDVVINADAQQGGDGGKVIAWSDGITRAYGTISARGGAGGGNGGFVETSGKYLDMQGRVDTRAPLGRTGTLLLDPTNIYIANTQLNATAAGMAGIDASADAGSPTFLAAGTVSDSLLTVSALQTALGTSSVMVSTANASGTGTGNIKVVDPISWANSSRLTLSADGGIAVNGRITAAAGVLSLRAAQGDIVQSAPITASGLLAYAGLGSVALADASNTVGTLAGHSGSSATGFSFINSGALTVGTVDGGNGVGTNNGAISLTTLSGNLDISGPLATAGGIATLRGAAGVSMSGTGAIATEGGALDIMATSANAPFAMSANTQIATAGGQIAITADNMTLGGMATAGAINSGSGGVTLAPLTAGTAVKVGASATDGIGVLGLTDTELNTVRTTDATTGALIVSSGAGTLDVDGALDLTTSGHLAGGLSLVASTGNVTVKASSPLTVPNALFMYTNGTLQTSSPVTAGSTIMLEANKMNLISGAISSPSSVSVVAPGVAIDLGSTTDIGAGLELSNAELNLFATPGLNFGSGEGHGISVTGTSVLAPAGVTSHISLNSTTDITVSSGAGIASTGGLSLTATGGFNTAITNGGTLQGNNVGLSAPRMALTGGTITGAGHVDLYAGLATDIWLGADITDATASTLELSSAELNSIHTPLLRVSSLGAGNIVIKSALMNGIGGAFEHLSGPSTLALNTGTGDISQLSGATIGGVSQLSLAGNSVSLSESNPTGVVSGAASRDFLFRSANQVTLGYVDGIHGITAGSESEVVLVSDNFGINQSSGNALRVPGGTLVLDAAGPAMLTEPGNQFRYVAAALNRGAAGVHGASAIYTAGDMEISIESVSGVSYTGVETNNQNVQLTAGAGSLTLNAPVVTTGSVTLTAGAANSPTASNVVTFESTVTAGGGLTVKANRVSGSLAPAAGPGVTLIVGAAPPPPPPPPPVSVAICLANPEAPGCGAFLDGAVTVCLANPQGDSCSVLLKAALTHCIANPTDVVCAAVLPTLIECIAAPDQQGCSVRLPSLPSCVADPLQQGCAVVLPTISACVANPTAPACTVVLPSLPSCIQAPAAPGCSVVLPTLPACVATPTGQGCSVVLPSLPACIATPMAQGCSVVLPSLPACIATPMAQGCSVVLPSLPSCVATPTAHGCSVVLPTLPACIATPTAQGCSVVLPTLPTCVASPMLAGCSVVLPTLAACTIAPATAGCSVVLPTLPQCIAAPSAQGCGAVLPKLAACIATPSAPGCSVVLPTLEQCTASPTLQGCSVVLPTLAQCATTPALAGCTAVLPTASFCSTHPNDAACASLKPPSAPEEGKGNSPINQATTTTVNIINTSTRVTATTTAGGGAGAGTNGAGDTNGKSKSDTTSGPAASANNGVKSNAPAKKMYCN